MKRRDPHAGDIGAEQRLDAPAHLFRGLVGEGDGEDFVRLRVAVTDQIGDAAGDDACLPGSGAGQDEERSFGVQDRFTLFGI